jgi:hypothetical protein
VKKEILIENEYFNKIYDNENKEIQCLNEEIEEYENRIREYKKEVDKKALLWKEDIKKISSEYLNSITSLKSSIKGYESLKKDLEVKNEIISQLEKSEVEGDKEKLEKERLDKDSFVITNSPKRGKNFPKRASLKSINEKEDRNEYDKDKEKETKDGIGSIKKGKNGKSPKKGIMKKGKSSKKDKKEGKPNQMASDNEIEIGSETISVKKSGNNVISSFDVDSNSKSKKMFNLKRPNI